MLVYFVYTEIGPKATCSRNKVETIPSKALPNSAPRTHHNSCFYAHILALCRNSPIHLYKTCEY